MKFATKFKTPQVAKEMLQQLEGINSAVDLQSHSYSPVPIEIIHGYTPSNVSLGSSPDVVKSNPLLERIAQLSDDAQLELISDVFSSHASRCYGLSVPTDFLKLSLCGMQCLKDAGILNVTYSLAKGLGISRPDGSDSLFPTSRMPMGLLQYMIEFFVTNWSSCEYIICMCFATAYVHLS